MSRLKKIKARMAAATQGPWFVVGGDEADGVNSLDGSITWDDHMGEVFKPEDAQFIAHAPEDMAEMVAVIEKVQALHVPNAGHNPECQCGIEAGAGARCVVCYEHYPCATMRIIKDTL